MIGGVCSSSLSVFKKSLNKFMGEKMELGVKQVYEESDLDIMAVRQTLWAS